MIGIENLTMPSFTPDMEALDEEGIRRDVRQTKSHGFFGTLCTSEAGLSFKEAERFVDIVADEAGDDLSVGTTAMFDTLEQTYQMLEHAESVGLDTVLLGYPPGWMPQSTEAVYETTEDLCRSADVGVVLHLSDKYNFDRLHPSGFPVDLLDRLADIDNAVAMEVSDPSMMPVADRACGDRLLLTNPIEGLLPNHVSAYDIQWLGAGPYEVYQTPEERLLAEYFRSLRVGDWEEAMETYWRLTPVREAFMQQMQPPLQVGTYHWPQMKYYQWLSGGTGGYTRQPVMELDRRDRRVIRRAREAAGLENTKDADESFFEGRRT
jgi:4-hydroxy-tetrahydrodipicolinate synthase